MAETAPRRPTATTAWHALSIEDALKGQSVDPEVGLSDAEVEKRRAQYGANKFAEAKKEPRWQAFVRQYRDPMQIVLLVAGIVSLFLPDQVATGVVLILLTVFNAYLGLNQEGKAEASVAALQKMMVVKAGSAAAARSGSSTWATSSRATSSMVEAGDLVPADGRLIRAATLEIDESALTGESVPVPKQLDAVAADSALGDRVDLAFMNTQVTRGAGTILVTSTGMAHRGRPHLEHALGADGRGDAAHQAAEQADQPDPRDRRRLARRSRSGSGSYRATPFDVLFLTAVAFAVSAIPTGLPAVVTTILSAGTQTLAKAGAIVKRLRSVETLGSTSAINSDKTGTLTLNQMTAVEMAVGGRRFAITGEGYSTTGQINRVAGEDLPSLDRYMLPMALCSDAVAKDGKLVGDPTEGALVVLASKGGVDPVLTRERYPRLAEVPFDAAYKLMATFHAMKDDAGKDVVRMYVKGAPDQLFARAQDGDDGTGGKVPVAQFKDKFFEENERLGRAGTPGPGDRDARLRRGVVRRRTRRTSCRSSATSPCSRSSASSTRRGPRPGTRSRSPTRPASRSG